MPQLEPRINFASQPFRATLGKGSKTTRAARLGFVRRTMGQDNAKNVTAHSNIGVPCAANLDMHPSTVRAEERKKKVIVTLPNKVSARSSFNAN